jgi:hypothetical protein
MVLLNSKNIMLMMIMKSLTDIKGTLLRIEQCVGNHGNGSSNTVLQELEAEKAVMETEIKRLRRENEQQKADIQVLTQSVYTAHESLAKLLQYQVALNEAVGMAYTDATIPDFVISAHVMKIHCDAPFKKN